MWAGFLVSTKSKQNYIVAGQESVTPCQWNPTAPSVWGSCDRGREGTREVIMGTVGDTSAVFLSWSPLAATMQSHMLCGLNNRNCFSHSLWRLGVHDQGVGVFRFFQSLSPWLADGRPLAGSSCIRVHTPIPVSLPSPAVPLGEDPPQWPHFSFITRLETLAPNTFTS